MDTRQTRRLAGLLSARLPDARLDHIHDPRNPRGRRWSLFTLLSGVLCGMASGATSLADVERLSSTLSPAIRKRLGIVRRIPDTTLRDVLCQLDPQQVTAALHATVRAAHRRKSLRSDALPFAVVSLDGKSTAISSCDDLVAQRQTGDDPSALTGVVRTITSTLVSNSAKPCIDVFPVPACTNEMGAFTAALEQLMTTYPALDIRLVAYDAGAASLANASAVVERHLHYLFCLRATQPTLYEAARLWLGTRDDATCDFRDERREGGCSVTRLIFIGQAQDGPDGWEHLRTILRVKTITVRSNGCTTTDERYLMSSLASDRLSPRQWQTIIRLRWGVETCHQILDTALCEDDHPWITQDPQGMLVVAILRRIVFTLLAIYRAITQRSDERRQMPWKILLEEIWAVLITATPEALLGIRHRPLVPSG